MKQLIILSFLCLVVGFVSYSLGFRYESKELLSQTTPDRVETSSLLLSREGRLNESRRLLDKALKEQNLTQFCRSLNHGMWLGPTELQSTLAAIREMDNPHRWYYWLLVRWSDNDMLGAIDFTVAELQEEPNFDTYFYVLFAEFSERDPANAFRSWKEVRSKLNDSSQAQGALEPLFGEWWRQDLHGALTAISSIDERDNRRSAVWGLGDGLRFASDEQRSELLNAIMLFDEPADRSLGLETFSAAMGREHSFDSLTNWIDRQEFGSDDQVLVERAAATYPLERNPREATEWLMKRSSPKSRSRHLSLAIEAWAEQEPNAAGEWLGRIDMTPETDEAVRGYSSRIAVDDFGSALAWAGQITDEELRASHVRLLVRSSAREHPKEVRNAILNANLSDHLKETLLADSADLLD